MSEGLHPRVHLSNQAKPGPPPERPRTPPPPPPPRWRMWLPWIGVAITLGILLFTSRMSGGQVQTLTYQPQLKDKIAAGQVKSVEIGSDGHIDGVLTDGTKFKSSYPVNLQDPQFTTLLEQHNVPVTAVGAQSSFVTVLVSLLPLLLFVGFFIYLGRSTRRQLGAIGGVGRSRGRVYDTDRPSTTFADVAGYEGVKREVTEVVDFLKNPDRYRRGGDGGHQPARGARPGAAATRPLRPSGGHPAADPARAQGDPAGPRQREEARPRRRPGRGRPRHPRVLRRRPGQPDQRGGDLRGPRRPRRAERHGLLRGARPDPAGAAGVVHRAAARREARGRGPRGRPRAGRGAVGPRRPDRQGHHPARRAGAGGDRAAPGGRAAPVLRGVPARLPGDPAGRPRRRAAGLRRGLDRRDQRPGRRHRPGHPDDPRVRHE